MRKHEFARLRRRWSDRLFGRSKPSVFLLGTAFICAACFIFSRANMAYFAEIPPRKYVLAGSAAAAAWLHMTVSSYWTEREMRQAIATQADLSHADLSESKLEGAHLRGRQLDGTKFSNADLTRADLSGASLHDARFTESLLEGANLRGAQMQRAGLHSAHLKGALMKEANLWRAKLSRTDLRQAELVDANLEYADLVDADLRGADLRGANLGGTDLAGARMRDTKISRAGLARTSLTDEQWSQVLLAERPRNSTPSEARKPRREHEVTLGPSAGRRAVKQLGFGVIISAILVALIIGESPTGDLGDDTQVEGAQVEPDDYEANQQHSGVQVRVGGSATAPVDLEITNAEGSRTLSARLPVAFTEQVPSGVLLVEVSGPSGDLLTCRLKQAGETVDTGSGTGTTLCKTVRPADEP